ncbi:class I SAM-dependent methyltransferase [filamentous cyanobacterium CCP3]|nr:class I SAM-dependent methyltransferase [filamentous cyanobacterium CCP3]
MFEPLSPLTKVPDVKLIKSISTKQLIKNWQQKFSIDISKYFASCEQIHLYQCNQTQLQFFTPDEIEGSGELYEQLQCFNWYYMRRKWEHDVAIQDLEGCKNVLEVGCGQGAFVQRLIQEHMLSAIGIESNKSAIQIAQSQGIPVSVSTLAEIACDKAKYFDAICAFQVLEHLSAPRTFIEDSIQLIKPGGKLILSVPNAESFAKHDHNNLLDQPPHHMHRWCKETFLTLQKVFPLDLVKFRIEPLAIYHIDWYLGIQNSRLPKIRLIRSPFFRISNYVMKPVLERYSVLRNLIVGHTLYVEFRVRS